MKPIGQLSEDDIRTMSEEEFTALILIIGPLRPPRDSPRENYLHQVDWVRLWKQCSMETVMAVSRRLGWAREDYDPPVTWEQV